MLNLEEARVIINEVDEEMAKLFEKRMKAVEHVVHYKMENNLPILDAKREAEVIERNINRLENEELKPYFKEFLEKSMEVSRNYQQSIIDSSKK
ncbi:chorismate mutase [Anaerorhabdus furcosa]|uniref:Chorismate mutase n=1 Tax=Anaerorhabdus furcosa TaxID=118967 RepID=A0A1T4PLE9_9FIRM|nr:chorismate mutase [Anaerorhabdus furcosa]SJZ91718.1 chorismate mutase [Anaerorhabdus furcosa]